VGSIRQARQGKTSCPFLFLSVFGVASSIVNLSRARILVSDSTLFTVAIHKREEGVMKEKSKGLKESKKAPQLSLKEKRKLKKEKKNR
jgi:hypothetical protein